MALINRSLPVESVFIVFHLEVFFYYFKFAFMKERQLIIHKPLK